MAGLSGIARLEGLPIIAVLLALTAVFMAAAPQVFLGPRIYLSFLTTVPPVLLLALGLTLVITAGEIDLSFPSVIAFSGYLLAYAVKDLGQPWLGVPLALLGGALVGFVNGFIVAVIGVPSIIATLATQFFWGGLTTGMSGGTSYSLRTVDQSWVHTLFVGRIGDFPVQFLWALGITRAALARSSTGTGSASTCCSSATTSRWHGWSGSRSSASGSSCSPSWACWGRWRP